MNVDRKLQLTAWLATLGLVGVSLAHWAAVRLSDGELGRYELYPLLGLIAFTLMWLHYTLGPVKRWFKASDTSLTSYFTITSWVVLVLILLHPALFMYTLWADGLGYPPNSYLGLYPELLSRIALLLGSISLIAFLAFEFHRIFKNRPWWRFVEYANIAAMFAILYHGFTLGGELDTPWFQALWGLYAVTLAATIIYEYVLKRKESTHA